MMLADALAQACAAGLPLFSSSYFKLNFNLGFGRASRHAPSSHSPRQQCRKASGHHHPPKCTLGSVLAQAALQSPCWASSSRQEQGEGAATMVPKWSHAKADEFQLLPAKAQHMTLGSALAVAPGSPSCPVAVAASASPPERPDWAGPKSRLFGILAQAAAPLTAGACARHLCCPACIA